MEVHNHNLNIHYTAPRELWNKIEELYVAMPFWNGYIDGCPTWYGIVNNYKIISASIEPSGLSFYANLPTQEWESWFELFKISAFKILGYEVGEPEDGYSFPILWFY